MLCSNNLTFISKFSELKGETGQTEWSCQWPFSKYQISVELLLHYPHIISLVFIYANCNNFTEDVLSAHATLHIRIPFKSWSLISISGKAMTIINCYSQATHKAQCLSHNLSGYICQRNECLDCWSFNSF